MILSSFDDKQTKFTGNFQWKFDFYLIRTNVQGAIIVHPAWALALGVGVHLHKNFNLPHNSWTITHRAFIFHMYIPCDNEDAGGLSREYVLRIPSVS